MEKLNMYNGSELERLTEKAEKLQQKYPYSEEDVKGTLEDLKIEEPYQEYVLAKYGKRKVKVSKDIEKTMKNHFHFLFPSNSFPGPVIGYKEGRCFFKWHCNRPMKKVKAIVERTPKNTYVTNQTMAYCPKCGANQDITSFYN